MRNALNELGEAKQSMSLEDIVKYLKENNNIDTTKDALRKILEPGSYYVKKDIAGNKVNTVRNVLLNLDSLENVTMDQLQNIPEI